MAMPQALYTIYRVRVMGASDWWIGVLLTTERVLSVLVYLALGRLLSRSRVRRWLWVTCIGVALYPLTMGLARTPEMLLIPAICGGIFGSGMNIFITNTLFQVSPEDGRPPFVAADATLANITSFVGPILGTALASAMGIAPALLVIAGFRVLGGLSFWRLKVGMET
jgi:MFS family permease